METKKLIINTVVEKKIQELSAAGLISANALYLVDDDDSNRTVLPSYDLMMGKIDELNKSINIIDTSIKSVNNEILGLKDKQVVELPSDILDSIKNLEDLTRETSATISSYSDTSFITIRDKNNVNKYYTISTDTETNTKIWVETQYNDALFIKQSNINTDSQPNAIDENNVEENISPLGASYAKLSEYGAAMLDLSATLNRYEISTDTKIPSSKLVYHTISALDAVTTEQIENLAKDVTDEIGVISTDLRSEITNQVETLSNDLSVELSVEINARQKAIKDLADRLSSAWKFQGVANELPTDVSQYANGDIIVVQIKDNDGKIVNTKEYGFDGEKFVELGSDYEYMASKNDLHTLSDAISTDLSVEIYNRDEAIKDLSASLSSDIDALSDGLSTDLATLSDDLSSDLSNEIAIRKDIDTYLSNQINALSDHISADVMDLSANLSNEIIAEINNRKVNDEFLSGQINALSDNISADVDALSDALSDEILALSNNLSTDIIVLSTALSTDLSVEIINRTKAIEDLSVALSTDIDALSDALSVEIYTETNDRKTNDEFLSGQIIVLSNNMSADVKALSTMLSTEISAEAIARDEAVEDLSTSLSNAVDAKILALSNALSADVFALSSNLSNEIDSLSNDIYKDLSIAMTPAIGTTNNILSSFTFTQNGQTIGTIDIPKDKVVDKAEVVKKDDEKTYLQLTIQNGETVEVEVPELVNTYTAIDSDTISMTVTDGTVDGYKISAIVEPSSIGAEHLQTDLSTKIQTVVDCEAADRDVIETLSGDETTEGSVAKAKADAIAEAESKVINLSTSLSNTVDAKILDLSTALSMEISTLTDATNENLEDLSTNLSTDLSVEAIARENDNAFLSTKIDSKLSIQIGDNTDPMSVDTLTIHKISLENYLDLSSHNQIASTDLYVISSEYVTGYDRRIVDVADGEEATDAATYGQLTNLGDKILISANKYVNDVSADFKTTYLDPVQILADAATTSSEATNLAIAEINKLTIEVISANTGKIVDTVSETNGKIAATFRDLTISEVSGLNDRLTTIEDAAVTSAEVSAIATSYALSVEQTLSTELYTNETGLSAKLHKEITDAATASNITLTEAEAPIDGMATTYVLTQGTEEVGKINIPKDKVINSAEVVFGTLANGIFTADDEGSNTKSEAAKFYLEVVVVNQDKKLYIPVPELADTYVGHIGTTIDVAIKSDDDGARCINAEVKAGSIGTNELANASVTTAKLADDAKNYIDSQINTALTTTIESLDAELTSDVVDSVISSINQENGVLMSIGKAKIQIAETQVTDLTSHLTTINNRFTQFANSKFDLRNSDGMANAISSLLVAFGANPLSIIA